MQKFDEIINTAIRFKKKTDVESLHLLVKLY